MPRAEALHLDLLEPRRDIEALAALHAVPEHFGAPCAALHLVKDDRLVGVELLLPLQAERVVRDDLLHPQNVLELAQLSDEIPRIGHAGDDERLLRLRKQHRHALGKQRPERGRQKLAADREQPGHDVYIIVPDHTELAVKQKAGDAEGQKLRENRLGNRVIRNFKGAEQVSERDINDDIQEQRDGKADALHI